MVFHVLLSSSEINMNINFHYFRLLFYMFYNTDFVLFKTRFPLFMFLLLLFLQISENPGTPTFPLNDTPVKKLDFTTS